MKKKVVIFQHRLLHYRVEFFEKLRSKCLDESIELNLVYGQASDQEYIRDDEGVIEWAYRVENYYYKISGTDVLWQKFPAALKDSDLIVIIQENRIISNYPILFNMLNLPGKIAYWGHGCNFQSLYPNGLRERWKKHLINKVDWWFAYSEITVKSVIKSGFPRDSITNLNNAINTDQFKHDYNSITEYIKKNTKDKLNIPADAKIGIFCGSLYKGKKIDLLLRSAEMVRKEFDFHLIIIGSGPELMKIKEYSKTNSWLHILGVQKGYNKSLYYRMSDVMLNPGLLGLHILDSLSIGIPLVSTINSKHGPEIAYVENGYNIILTKDNPESYSNSILSLLEDNSFYNRIKSNAIKSGSHYSIDKMVENFLNGIIKSIN